MNKKKAFVLMPFAEEFSDVYKFLIFDSLNKVGYEVKRADNIKSQNNILNDIIESIVSSDLIIADLTGENPNVYYELGIAHALNKKVILLTQNIDGLPFDLRSYRVLPYDMHFSKMIQAKEELFQLATEAFKNELKFGNPVKDFSSITSINNSELIHSNELINNQELDLGFLDYQVKMEEGFEKITEIVENVGKKLKEEVTPEILNATEKNGSGKHSAKEKIVIIQNLASHLQAYAAFIKPKNEAYRVILHDIENGLEYILGGNMNIEKENIQGVMNFIETLSDVEESAFQGRQGFTHLIEAMHTTPKIEKNFNLAKDLMIAELEAFVANVDQTISVISRAIRLGKSIIDKTQKSM